MDYNNPNNPWYRVFGPAGTNLRGYLRQRGRPANSLLSYTKLMRRVRYGEPVEPGARRWAPTVTVVQGTIRVEGLHGVTGDGEFYWFASLDAKHASAEVVVEGPEAVILVTPNDRTLLSDGSGEYQPVPAADWKRTEIRIRGSWAIGADLQKSTLRIIGVVPPDRGRDGWSRDIPFTAAAE